MNIDINKNKQLVEIKNGKIIRKGKITKGMDNQEFVKTLFNFVEKNEITKQIIF